MTIFSMFLWSPNQCDIYYIIYTLIESKLGQPILTKSNSISKTLSLKSNKISTFMYQYLDSRLTPQKDLIIYCHFKQLFFDRNQTSTLVDLGQTTCRVSCSSWISNSQRCVTLLCNPVRVGFWRQFRKKHQQKSSLDVPTATECMYTDSFPLGHVA